MSRGRAAVAVGVLLLGLAGVAAVPTTSGSLTGAITNTTSTASTGLYPGRCTDTARASSPLFVWPFDDNGPVLLGTTARDVSGSANAGTYSAFGVTYRVSGAPCPRDSPAGAVTLNGSSGSVHGPSSLLGLGSLPGPQTYSTQVWFRTTTTSGGKLVGFGNGSTAGSTSFLYDRHVYMTNDGRLVAGVNPGVVRTVTSPASYNDGTWHHVVSTLGTNGLRLYVDGVLVGSDTAATGAETYNGTWRFGYDNLDLWPSRPTSRYFAGSLAWGAVWNTALSPTQVIELYYAGR